MQRWIDTNRALEQHHQLVAAHGLRGATALEAAAAREGMPWPVGLSREQRGGSVHDSGLQVPLAVPYL